MFPILWVKIKNKQERIWEIFNLDEIPSEQKDLDTISKNNKRGLEEGKEGKKDSKIFVPSRVKEFKEIDGLRNQSSKLSKFNFEIKDSNFWLERKSKRLYEAKEKVKYKLKKKLDQVNIFDKVSDYSSL